MKFYTIGVYHTTEEEFFNKLKDHNIDTFCDIRQRRGIRGREYAFANSEYLQQKLYKMDIKYIHLLNLAPTASIREKQKHADIVTGEKKRDRHQLGEVFIREYKDTILNKFNFDLFFEELDRIGASKVVFFCVEQEAKACHRSIVAEELSQRYNYEIIDL